MATMKDVAKLAGVSHGTVSNILNGYKGVSLDKIERVENAIKEIGYTRNTLARNLKRNSTMQIDVILPNIIDCSNAQLYTRIEQFAGYNDYKINLKITNDMPVVEMRMLQDALKNNSSGIVLMTCQPGNREMFDRIENSGVNIVFIQRKPANRDCNSVHIDATTLIKNSVREKLTNGQTLAMIVGRSEFTFEQMCINSYKSEFNRMGVAFNKDNLKIISPNKENAMKAAIRIIEKGCPDTIYTTSKSMADGISNALNLVMEEGKEKRPKLVVLTAHTWSLNNDDMREYLPLPFTMLGESAIKKLIDLIDNNNQQYENIIIPALIEEKQPKKIVGANKKRPLRVLMHASPASSAIVSLKKNFKNTVGLDIEVSAFGYEDTYNEIIANGNSGKYDALVIDIPWLGEIVEKGIVLPIGSYLKANKDITNRFSPQIFNAYSSYQDSLYAVPFEYSAQMLFYRKDLFDNFKIQHQYYEMYKKDLSVPKSWDEFNQIARFFTRKYNEASPTTYGAGLGGKFSNSAFGEFLPRLKFYGGDIFKDGKVAINDTNAVMALKNYAESYKYAHPNSHNFWWYELTDEFVKGDTAMMMLYSAHSGVINDISKSNVAGRIAAEAVPGNISILGGWSMGICAASDMKDETFELLKWITSDEITVPAAILGGFMPTVSMYTNMELANMFPWQRKVMDVFEHTFARSIPHKHTGMIISERELEDIVGKAVYNVITKKMEPEEALRYAENELIELIK